MRPWETLATAEAADGTRLELRRRGHEYLITADGYDLMSSEDGDSARALADLGCARLPEGRPSHVLVGGLGMGYTLRAALDRVGENAHVEVAELVSEVALWNRGELGALAGRPLDDPRTHLHIADVADVVRSHPGVYDAILLDVDNGPDALAHATNEHLYGRRGITQAKAALRPGGTLAAWSFSDDPAFTRRLAAAGFSAQVHRVPASRKGRGRFHFVWTAQLPK